MKISKTVSVILLFTLSLITLENKSMAIFVNENIKKTVIFIFTKNDKGELIPQGTGFLVGIENEYNPGVFNAYLVTAKHVLQQRDRCEFINPLYIRLNKIGGGTELILLPLNKPQAVHFHKDPLVDIAVIPLYVSDKIYEVKGIPNKWILTKEKFNELKIREGDEVFFAGLFTSYYGKSKNYPIVRFGRVTLVTDEKIPWSEDGKTVELADLYLLECQSFGGNSGSPVFYYFGGDRDPNQFRIGNPDIYLAGIMKGTFLNKFPIGFIETGRVPISLDNVGIAAVTPSYKLHEILFSNEVKNLRKDTKLVH